MKDEAVVSLVVKGVDNMVLSPTYCVSCGTANRADSAFCHHCGNPLARGGPPSGPTGRLASGQVLRQRYRILQIIGQGGMGAVYKAEDIPFGNRLVAVKEMRQTGLDPQEVVEAAEQFKQEALLLAGLKHPSLPSIYDHFSQHGRWNLDMDIIEGETLFEHLDKAKGRALPISEVLDIGIQLSKVLGYLHTRPTPIIFRDLKPANIMLTPDGNVYLIDFGIARFFKPGQAKDTAAYGSAGYSSPEQYGRAQTTPRSDIYSLGATLHEMLSGTDPSSTPFRFAPLPSLGQPALTELAALITRMLDMDAQRRPASMAAVKQALERIADQRLQPPVPPTRSMPPTTPTAPAVAVPQNKGTSRRVVVIGLIALVVVGGIALETSYSSAPLPVVPSPTHPLPQLASSYTGTVDNTTGNISASFSISSITEDQQGNIRGQATVGPPLTGSGPFTGSVDTNNSIQFTVTANDGSGVSIHFTGFVNADNSLSGSYTVSNNQTGIWQVR